MNTNGINHKTSQDLNEALGKYLTVFYNFKCVLNEPRLLDLSNVFFAGTCSWLVHLAAIQSKNEETISRIQKLPLLFEPNEQLSYIPEFIVENLVDYWKFLLRFNPIYFEVKQNRKTSFSVFKSSFFKKTMGNSLDVYVDFILVFMGDRTRLRNPYLRAILTELLEFLLPTKNKLDTYKNIESHCFCFQFICRENLL